MELLLKSLTKRHKEKCQEELSDTNNHNKYKWTKYSQLEIIKCKTELKKSGVWCLQSSIQHMTKCKSGNKRQEKIQQILTILKLDKYNLRQNDYLQALPI